jgi:DNA repair exonuclease SbcCD nuclease subunit
VRGLNRITLERLPSSEIDYIALGDWHGIKQVNQKVWYSGTPEIDRFPKRGVNGKCLSVFYLDHIRGRQRPFR